MDKLSTIKKIDDKTIQIKDYEITTYEFGIHLKYSAIVFIVVVSVIVAAVFFLIKASDSVVDESFPFSSDGFILPNSSSEFISDNDFNRMMEQADQSEYTYGQLLRYAVNEIYARHGFSFRPGGEFDTLYSQQKWYTDLEKVPEVSWGKLNQYEKYNLEILVNEEKRIDSGS